MFFTDQYIIGFMLETLKNFGGKKLGGLILIIVIIIEASTTNTLLLSDETNFNNLDLISVILVVIFCCN